MWFFVDGKKSDWTLENWDFKVGKWWIFEEKIGLNDFQWEIQHFWWKFVISATLTLTQQRLDCKICFKIIKIIHINVGWPSAQFCPGQSRFFTCCPDFWSVPILSRLSVKCPDFYSNFSCLSRFRVFGWEAKKKKCSWNFFS